MPGSQRADIVAKDGAAGPKDAAPVPTFDGYPVPPRGPRLERDMSIPTAAPERTAVPGLLRWCVHLLVAGLLVLTVLRGPPDPGRATLAVTLLAVLVGAIYLSGTSVAVLRRAGGATVAWLLVLLAVWVALLLLTPDAVYLAFPWFFLLLALLPRLAGLAAVAGTAVAAVAGFAWHQEAFTAAMVIGPVLGAAVAVATVWGYQALAAESEQRRQLIAELRRTRDELADAERQSGVLAERERLAREIHDTLAQGLSSIQLLLRAAGRTLAAGMPGVSADGVYGCATCTDRDIGRAADLVEQARSTAQDNLVEARRVVAALAPAGLQETSLAPALQRLSDTTSRLAGIPVTFRQEGVLGPLPTPVEVALLRIAQSALGNATRHAHASRIGVTLSGIGSTVTLDIVDDGVGFDTDVLNRPVEPGPDGGFGLRSMRSRAAELGGAVTVESEPGLGTAVAVSIDLARSGTGGP